MGTTQQAVAHNLNIMSTMTARAKNLLLRAKELERRAHEGSTTAQNVGN